MRTRLIAAAVLLFGVARAALGGETGRDYEIRLQRPAHVGERFEMLVHAVSKQHTTEHGPWRPDESVDQTLEIALAGHVEVLAVSDTGVVTKLACAVVKTDYSSPKGSGTYIPPGRVIVAESKGGATLFSTKGQHAPPREDAILEMVFPMSDPAGTMDRFMGTGERKAIGASWPIDARGAVEDMKGKGFECRVEDLTGSSKVVGLVKQNAIECLKVESIVDCKDLKNVTAESQGTKLNVSLHGTMTRWLPLDPQEREVAVSTTFRQRHISTRAAPGSQGQFITTVTSESTIERSYSRSGSEPVLPPTSQPSN